MTENKSDLTGRLAVVTSGARGIGRAIADTLASRGADIAIFDVLAEEGEATASELAERHNTSVAFFDTDITSEKAVEASVAAAQRDLGPITVLISNAGWKATGPAHALDTEGYDRTLAVHSRGLFLLAKHCVPDMVRQGGGSIVAISSMQALASLPGRLAYSAAKAAICGTVRQLAVEYGPFNIRANAILPGAIMTETNLARLRSELTEAEFAALEHSYPLRRFGHPEDVADAVLFLVSDSSRWITGASLLVDGGATIQLAEASLYPAYEQFWSQTAQLLEGADGPA